MIKVTLGASNTQEVKPFPKLMKSRFTEAIVFFESEGVGQVIHEGNGIVPVGEILNTCKIKDFTDYNEPITIQNA